MRCPSSNGMMSFWWQPLFPVITRFPHQKKTSFRWFFLTIVVLPPGSKKTRASELYLFSVASSGSFLPPVVTSHRIPGSAGHPPPQPTGAHRCPPVKPKTSSWKRPGLGEIPRLGHATSRCKLDCLSAGPWQILAE